MKLLFFLALLLTFPVFCSAETIRLRADIYPPYNAEPASEHEGYMVEVARRVFEKAGHKVDYQIMPWARSIKESEAGTVDGIICAGKGDAPSFVFPDEPLGVLRYSIFVPKASTWRYEGAGSLANLKLGVIAEYSYGATIDAHIAKHATDTALVQSVAGDEALEQNIQKLVRGRISGVVSSADVFGAAVDSLKLSRDDFREAGVAPEQDPVYIAFSPSKPSSKEYARILSDGIIALRASGELGRILARYKVKDWK